MKRERNYSLIRHNTFGLDVRCKEFIEYNDTDELRQVLRELQSDRRRFLPIGCGSNLLFTKDFDGTVLHSGIQEKEVVRETGTHVYIRAGAGINWDWFVADCIAHGYYGAENLSLIPGEVGAAAVQNIGAYGCEAGHLIAHVETVEAETGASCVFSQAECRYAYRSSIFKGAMRAKHIITYVTFRLSKTFVPVLSYGGLQRELSTRSLTADSLSAQALREIIIQIRRNKLPDPETIGSAGSFFMNPIVKEEVFSALRQQYPDMPHYVLPDGVKIPAGWLIEQCGWKGRNLGPAGVYEKQALVLVNRGQATGKDIVNLSDAIRQNVHNRFGIELIPEVNFI